MKKKKVGIIASSVAAIAVCSSMVVGSTLALFTSEDKVNIAVSSGKVSVVSTIGELTTSNSLTNFTETGMTNVAFENGGFASVDGSAITFEGISSGDKVTFDVTVDASESTIAVKQRFTYAVNGGFLLASGLQIEVNEKDVSGYELYTSNWKELKADKTDVYSVSLSLPNTDTVVDNLYQDLTTNITFAVEAVQANAATGEGETSKPLPDFATAEEAVKDGYGVVVADSDEAFLEAAKESKKYIALESDVNVGSKALTKLDNITIDACGHTIDFDDNALAGVNGENVNILNAKFFKGTVLDVNGNPKDWGINGNINYYNCEFNEYSPYYDGVPDNITVDGCTFNNTTLQFGECKGFGNIKITNNIFNIDNADAQAHAIVFGGATKEFWESGADGLVIEGNTFNPLHEDEPYLAYYIYAGGGDVLNSAPEYVNNTFNGKTVNYAINLLYKPEKKIIKLNLIRNVEELKDLAKAVNEEKNNYENERVYLTADLNLEGVEWTPIGGTYLRTETQKKDGKEELVDIYSSFKGTFDGCGHTISNLTINSTDDYVGLFGYATNASIKNLTISNFNITGGVSVGGLVGQIYGRHSSIENVKAINVTVNANHYGGAIAGHADGEINYCVVNNSHVTLTLNHKNANGEFDDGDKAGLIAGFLGGFNKAEGNVAKNSTVTAYRDLGGLFGNIQGTANDGDKNNTFYLTDNTVENVTLKYTLLEEGQKYEDGDENQNCKATSGRYSAYTVVAKGNTATNVKFVDAEGNETLLEAENQTFNEGKNP